MLKTAIIASIGNLLLWSASADPLLGYWVANLQRSRFSAGFPALKHQSMKCEPSGKRTKCVAVRIAPDGTRSQMEFTAEYDGREYPVAGSREVTGVTLTRRANIVDAIFLRNGTAVLGYELKRAADGRSLTVTSIDPANRRKLSSVVAYERK